MPAISNLSEVAGIQVHEALKLDQDGLARWENRWPRFVLYSCGVTGCKNVLLYQGLCPEHGGPEFPPLRIDGDGYFVVRLPGGYFFWHKLIVESKPGEDVHHEDRNKLNNRPSNLKVLSHQEHWAGHHKPLP